MNIKSFLALTYLFSATFQNELFASEEQDPEKAYLKTWENTTGDRPEILKKVINLEDVTVPETDESSMDNSYKRERRAVFLKYALGSNGSPSASNDDEDSVLASSIIEPAEERLPGNNNN